MTTTRFAKASLWSACALSLAACGPGPTVYVGAYPAADGGADASLPQDRDSAQDEEDQEEAEEDGPQDGPGSDDEEGHQNEGEEGEDMLPCLSSVDCAGAEEQPRCHTERNVCVACLSDRDCPVGSCDVAEGECEHD